MLLRTTTVVTRNTASIQEIENYLHTSTEALLKCMSLNIYIKCSATEETIMIFCIRAVLDKVVKIILKYCLHLIQIQINRQKKK